MEEKRSSPRLGIELKVDYERLNGFIADYTANLSRGGTFVRTPQPLDVGTRFLLRLGLPGAEDLELLGEVSWILRPEDAPEPTRAGMGVRFLFEDAADHARFEAAVERLIRDHLGPEIARGLMTAAR